MGKPKAIIHQQDKPGPFQLVQPTKAEVNPHFSLGSFNHVLFSTSGGDDGDERRRRSPRSWSKLQLLRAVSPCRAASSAVEHVQLQRPGVGVEPAAAAFMGAWRASSADITLDVAAEELL